MPNMAYVAAVYQAGVDLKITPRGIVIGLSVPFVESDWLMYANSKVPASLQLPHDAVGSDGFSVGLQQQQVVMGDNGQWWWGDAATCMDAYKSSVLFFQRLAKLDYNNTANSPGSYAQAVQQSAFPDRYDERMADAQALYNQISSGGTVTQPPPVVDPNRPDFNEFGDWCDNNQDREGTTIDLILLHTQEGSEDDDNAALDLAEFCKSTTGTDNPVSYHYAARTASDGGTTVVDMVDTDLASWSVANSNNRSINYCFAGSDASWSYEQWMTQAKTIDVVAYLVVQDCLKYGIPPTVIPGPAYGKNPPGISDHRYCTDWLKDGNTHVDVGDNFPWDVFSAAVAKYYALATSASGGTTPTNVTAEPTGDAALKTIAEQLLGPWDAVNGRFTGWPQLGQNPDGSNRSLVDAVAVSLATLSTSVTPAAPVADVPATKPAKRTPTKRTPAKKTPVKTPAKAAPVKKAAAKKAPAKKTAAARKR